MADANYTAGFGVLLRGATAWDTGDYRAILIDTGVYTFSAAHTSLADIPAGARLATLGATLANKTVTDAGLLDCDDWTWPSVASGDTAGAYVIYQHTGSDATATPCQYVDSATGFPLSTDGNNVAMTLPAGGVLDIS